MDQKIIDLLCPLATKLGTTVEHLWMVLVKQAYYEGFYSVINFIILMLFCFLVFKVEKIFWYKDYDDSDAKDFVHGLILGVDIIFSVVFIISILCSTSVISKLINPEYIALQRLLSMIK